MWPFGRKKQAVQPDSANVSAPEQRQTEVQATPGKAVKAPGNAASEEQARKAAQERAVRRLSMIVQMAENLKQPADRDAYRQLMDVFTTSAAEAGTAPVAEQEAHRADEALKEADRRIGRGEVQEALKNLVLRMTEINKKEDDGKLQDSVQELDQLHDRMQREGLDGDKGISRLDSKVRKDLEKAKGRVQRDKKHKMADRYSELSRKIRGDNQRTDLKREEAEGLTAVYERELLELDQLRSGEYNLPSQNIDKAKAAVESELALLKAKTPQGSRQKKMEQYSALIAGKKGSPLEQLIGKVATLPEGTGFLPVSSGQSSGQPSGSGANTMRKRDVIKEKIRSVPGAVKSSAKEAFSDWKTGLETVYNKLTGSLDTASGSSGIGADSQDIQDINGVVKDLVKADTSEAGLTAAVLGGVGAILKTIKGAAGIVKYFRERASKDPGKPLMDAQEHWKVARSVMHELVDIIGGFQGAFAPWSKMIPFFNSIAGLCINGAAMLVDIMDMITSSVHVDMMRRDRNRIYKRIQEKKLKYSAQGRSTDQEAEAAYTIDKKWFRSRGRDVDATRRALMDKMASQTPGVTLAGRADMRSRNDSYSRNIQYGLGARIQAAGAAGTGTAGGKSQKRQLEALEMMEQFRETDKAHKKMVKALLHNLESIGSGGVSIVANALKLAGEICVTTVVGAPVGAALITAGMATGIAQGSYEQVRDLASAGYKGVRTLIGTEDNKATTREDMAISLIDRMAEVGGSAVMGTDRKFLDQPALQAVDPKVVVRQGRNVEHLHSILRRGLDVSMRALVKAPDKASLKEEIAGAFGQED